MIVIGITPGLKSLAYSAIEDSGSTPVLLDQDTLLGPRMGLTDGLVGLAKKAYVHHLILSVVFERSPPAALAIGPPCDSKEPPERVEAVQTILVALARKFDARVIHVAEPDIARSLEPHAREGYFRLVNRHLTVPGLAVDERKTTFAVAVGLAGALMLRSLPR